MKIYESNANICVKGNHNIVYRVAEIQYLEKEDGYTRYTFIPNYSVISLLDSKYFQGIPGLNLDLKRERYIRENMTPVFISERVPMKNRVDYQKLLNDVGLEVMEPIQYLLRTKLQYFGDNFFLLPYKEKETFTIKKKEEKKSSSAFIRELLEKIAAGDDVSINGCLIDDDNRKTLHGVLMFIYSRSIEAQKLSQKEGIAKAKESGVYKGRKPKKVDILKFEDALAKIERKNLSVKDACLYLGISVDKFYREKKKLTKR